MKLNNSPPDPKFPCCANAPRLHPEPALTARNLKAAAVTEPARKGGLAETIKRPRSSPAGAAAAVTALIAGCSEPPQIAEPPFSAFGSISQFEDAQRMAAMLTHSSLVPDSFRGDQHLGDCVLALEIANRIGASVLAVMQNLRLVQGKPAWSSQFLISCLNATKRFSAIRYQMTGTRGEDSWGCVAWASDKTGEVLCSPEVTLKMAKEVGWYDRAGSKWKTMPELMLCYRSATLFTRLYAPEITMGIQTAEEVVDAGAGGNGKPSRPIFATEPATPNSNHHQSKGRVREEIRIKAAQPAASASQNATGTPPQKASVDPSATSTTPAAQYNHLKALTGLIKLSRHTEESVLVFLRKTHRCVESSASLAEVAGQQPQAIIWAHDNWRSVDQELARIEQERTL